MQPIFSLKITQLCAAFLFIVQFSRFESYRPTDELDRIRIANLTKLLFPKGKHSLRISAKEDDLPCLHFNHVITDNEALEKRRLPSLFHTAALNTIKKFSHYNFITGNSWKLKTCDELLKLSNAFAIERKQESDEKGFSKEKFMKKANKKKSKRRVLERNTDDQNIRKQYHASLNGFTKKSSQQKEGDSNINMVPKAINGHKMGVRGQRQDLDVNEKMDVSARKLEGLDSKNLPAKIISESVSEPLSRYMRRRISNLENEDKKIVQGQ